MQVRHKPKNPKASQQARLAHARSGSRQAAVAPCHPRAATAGGNLPAPRSNQAPSKSHPLPESRAA
eukprot:13865082-Alexandrium_andersonii.AAC.1